MNVICLVLDRIHLGYLGAFGNAWVETPALDGLAFDSFVFDQFFADTPRLDLLYRSYWEGYHALEPTPVNSPGQSLPDLLQSRGIVPTLMTDEADVARHPLAARFQEILELKPPVNVAPTESAEQTRMAECFANLIDWLETARPPFFLWCHWQALAAAWDAPLALRRRYADEDDPLPPDSAEVPNVRIPPNFDPDELLGIHHSYAGQIALLDMCLAALHDFLQASSLGAQTLLVVLGARGFPLGEHGRVGPCDEAIFGETVRCPLLVRFPDGLGRAGRSQAFAQPGDLQATILDWLGIPSPATSTVSRSLLPVVRGEAESIRDRIGIAGKDSQRAIVTPAWYLRLAETAHLYVRPDDYWQINDVADRCPNVVEELREVFAEYEQALQASQSSDSSPLSDILRRGID